MCLKFTLGIAMVSTVFVASPLSSAMVNDSLELSAHSKHSIPLSSAIVNTVFP